MRIGEGWSRSQESGGSAGDGGLTGACRERTVYRSMSHERIWGSVSQIDIELCLTNKIWGSISGVKVAYYVSRVEHFVERSIRGKIAQHLAETALVKHEYMWRTVDYVSRGETFAKFFRRQI